MRITLTFYLRRGTVHVGSVAELFNCLAFNPNLSKSVYLNLNPDFYSSGLLAVFPVFLSVMLIVLKDQLQGDFLLSLKAPTSNALKQFVDCCRRIVWVCLTILWGWHLKG